MIGPDYEHFGGQHWESAALANTLAHAGVISPYTGKPLSEPMCLGIAGGIAAGYSFCPSIPGYNAGSGVSAVGRYRAYATGPTFYEGMFQRIGAKVHVKETSGKKAAMGHLRDALEAGKPAIVWCGPPPTSYLTWSCTYGMYTTVVHRLDEDKNEAHLGDMAATSLTISLDDLERVRGQVCSHKNRVLTFTPPKQLTKGLLKEAVLEGVRACADDFLRPKLKTYNLPGLLEWSKVIANPKNKKGWPRVFGVKKLYLPLRDTFESIETAGTGGSLFRPLYADFLDEAAEITGRRALADCAAEYRDLGKEWSRLAEAALPNRVAACKETKQLLKKRRRLFESKGAKARKEIDGLSMKLGQIEMGMLSDPPLDESQAETLLSDLSERLRALHDGELETARRLERAVA